MKNKIRLDNLLVEKGLFPTKSKAQAAIMAGIVFVKGQKVEKGGTFVSPDDPVQVVGGPMPYVGRGGLKLEKALSSFGVNVSGRIAADIGASTGGFTDCLLQQGVKLVYAIDVGYGQLDMKIRTDNRVVPIERTNARHLTWPQFQIISQKAIQKELKQSKQLPLMTPERPDLFVMDVSFISILKILPAIKDIAGPTADIVSLVKPQFEARREQVGKGGIIKSPEVHSEVLEKVSKGAADLGFTVNATCDSPITGSDGNKEFFIYLQKT